jgi:exopolysaccharide biosynthesis polyprenyl glycosylphosphotransferase
MRAAYGRRVSAIAPTGRRAWRLWRSLDLGRDILLGPLGGAIVLAFLARPGDPPKTFVLSFLALAIGGLLGRPLAAQAALLPLMRHARASIGPVLGLGVLTGIEVLTGEPNAGPLDLLAALGASAFLAQPWPSRLGAPAPGSLRVAFIGPPAAAARLDRALEAAGSRNYALVGRVSCPGESKAPGPPVLGPLGGLADLVVEHDIDVLVMGQEAPRLSVFGEVADSCLDLPVRLVELSALFEEVFGHVPVAEINAAWFQCLADPHLRVSTGPLKRTLDIVGATVVLLLTLPLLVVLWFLIRLDGGPGLFSQIRIGEGGRRFRLRKLRTMVVGADASAQWACPDDPRTTRVGGFLRRTHLDELPQLVNVIRGDMSLVGPRPEQPEFVDRLERMLPFYQRRHLMRPGITGWAQIRCGYAGSDIGSAWKLCHDLYYAKHRSFGLDVLILCETLATLFFERQPVMRPESVAYVLADERTAG